MAVIKQEPEWENSTEEQQILEILPQQDLEVEEERNTETENSKNLKNKKGNVSVTPKVKRALITKKKKNIPSKTRGTPQKLKSKNISVTPVAKSISETSKPKKQKQSRGWGKM